MPKNGRQGPKIKKRKFWPHIRTVGHPLHTRPTTLVVAGGASPEQESKREMCDANSDRVAEIESQPVRPPSQVERHQALGVWTHVWIGVFRESRPCLSFCHHRPRLCRV